MNVLCICASVCVSVNACLSFDALMKLQSVLSIFIVILFMSCKGFPRKVHINLVEFELDFHSRKVAHPNGFFIYFGGFNLLVWILG